MNKEDFRNSIKYDINKNHNNDNKVRYTAKKNTHNKHRVSNQTRRRISALVLSGILALGAYGCSQGTKKPDFEHGLEITTTNENRLNSAEAILNDFKERYIKEYNEQNKTKYTANQLEIYYKSQDYLYETNDGQHITHGSYPEQTEKILKQYDGSSKDTDGGQLIQVLIDGKVIDACIEGDSKRVLSGNELDTLLDDLNAHKGNEESLLSSNELKKLSKYCMQIQMGYNKNDIEYCKSKYKEIAKDIDNKAKDGFEIE